MSRLSSPILSLWRLGCYFLATLALMPVQLAALGLGAVGLGHWAARSFPPLYHRWVLALLGFRLVVLGRRSTARPTLFISNHASYIDIELLASVIPGSFVAKTEVKGWPLFGLLARLQRTVFVERRSRRASAGQRDAMARRLEEGGNLILFPEGTTSDGNRVMPFKSALFGAAATRVAGRPVMVQPVTVAYTRLNGVPIGRTLRPLIAWYGDMTLGSHLWTMVGLGRIEAVILFHPPVSHDQLGSRKALAEHCQRVIAEGLSALNAGRIEPRPETLPAREALQAAGGDAVTAT